MKLEKKAPQVPDIMNLPKPRPGRGGGLKLFVLALLALLVVGGAAFWLTRDKETRDQWREQTAAVIDNATSGTPLAGVSDLLRDAPPPPPPSVTSPSTAPGTFAGQNVQGTVGAPVDTALPSGQAGLAGEASGGQPKPGFRAGCGSQSHGRQQGSSRLCGGSGGISGFALQAGTGRRLAFGKRAKRQPALRLENDRLGPGAAARLSCVMPFIPPCSRACMRSMWSVSWPLWGERLRPRGFTPEQTRQMFMLLAGRFVMVSGGLEGVAATPDLSQRLKGLDQLSQAAVEISSQMTVAVFELDQLRENKAPASQISTAQLRVDGLSARYRRALEERGAAQRALVATIRKGGGQALDEDSLLFLARWVERRLRQDAQALASVQSAAGILRDLARRCAQAGAGASAQPAPAATSPATAPASANPSPAGGNNAALQTGTPLPAGAPTAPAALPTVPAPVQVGGQGR